MQTNIVVLSPAKLENADLDLRYRIPERTCGAQAVSPAPAALLRREGLFLAA